MNDYLNIDYLKSNKKMIHFFGLGFVQLKLSDKERVHFYHPSLEAFTEEPHNHRRYFFSKVLKGSLKNIIWKFGSEGEFAEMRYESCDKNNKNVPKSWNCFRQIIGEFVVSEGTGYFLEMDTFHQVKRVGSKPCITLINRGPKTYKKFAQILEKKEADQICPFSKNLPEKELWEVVEDCLVSE